MALRIIDDAFSVIAIPAVEVCEPMTWTSIKAAPPPTIPHFTDSEGWG
jgi:hypothetical protein